MKKSNSNAFITKDSEVQGFMESAAAFLKRHYKVIILIFLGYISVSVLNFFDVATSQTIANYRLSDFEIGQISDRTIYAPRSIPADELNPVFIEEGEKIIKKGFPITEEAFAKLKKMSESPVYLDYRACFGWCFLCMHLSAGNPCSASLCSRQYVFLLYMARRLSAQRRRCFRIRSCLP